MKVKALLDAAAKDGQPRTLSCSSTADASRGVGWAAGPIKGTDMVYAAMMEGERSFPGRMMAERLEAAFRRAKVSKAGAMTILVTGSAGHLGEALVRTLRAAGRPVRGLDVKASAWTDVIGSITERAVVDGAMAGASAVIHAATLHKPHVATHSRADFVDVNVHGALNLTEAAAAAGVSAFVFTSTTSVFGRAMNPAPGTPAAWIDEDVRPVAKNIYGVTKAAAEDIVELAHLRTGLPAVVLRVSRFFPEADDDRDVRGAFEDANLKANEFAFRRLDVADAVGAHLAAIEAAPRLGFGRYVVSATTPFERGDAAALGTDAPAVLAARVPAYAEVYARRGWRMFAALDRVYDNARARADLGWRPAYDFARVIDALAAGQPPLSPLAQAIGAKGYHDAAFEDGPYPVAC
jgi:UDP-glucose 4-epimerase